MSIVLFSNNPLMRELHLAGGECHYSEGSALLVLEGARDAIHDGWKLLHHPLYGNYRPYQQPYRTLLLERTPPSLLAASAAASTHDGSFRIVPDLMSIHLIEEAFEVFRSTRVITPGEAPASMLHDCSVLDFELMRLPLQQAGWEEPLGGTAGRAFGPTCLHT